MSGFNSELLTILADCEPFLCEKLTALLRIDEETLLQRIAELRQQGIRIDMKERQVRDRSPADDRGPAARPG